MRVRQYDYSFEKKLLWTSIVLLTVLVAIILARPAAAEPFSIRSETEELHAQLCAQKGERADGTCDLGSGTEHVRVFFQEESMRELFEAEAELLPVLADQELARERITLAKLRAELSELQLANGTAVPVEEYQAVVAKLKRTKEELFHQTERAEHFLSQLAKMAIEANVFVTAIKDHCVRNGKANDERRENLFWAEHELCQSEAGQKAFDWHRLLERFNRQ